MIRSGVDSTTNLQVHDASRIPDLENRLRTTRETTIVRKAPDREDDR
jgi:hypothetical protein